MSVSPWSRRLHVLFTLAALVLIAPPVHAAAWWYVAPSGSNLHDCLTPATARATITGVFEKPSFAAGDTVRMAVGTYTGTGPEVVRPTKSVTLSGGWDTVFAAQAGTSTIDGQDSRRGITIATPMTVTIDRVMIQHGADTAGGGGAIYNESGTLLISNSTLRNNTSLYPRGSAIGGAIYNRGGTLAVRDSAVYGNIGDFNGGGIANLGGSVSILHTTIMSNTAGKLTYNGGGGGGGILNLGGTLIV
ncbi:MAG TPA: hypothetical protein VGJ87_23795 [Roseiflexaceae bacterium]|jgi:hypothetical protein